jgi:hypothetical protein
VLSYNKKGPLHVTPSISAVEIKFILLLVIMKCISFSFFMSSLQELSLYFTQIVFSALSSSGMKLALTLFVALF